MNLFRYISLSSSDKIERFYKLLNENKLYFSSPQFFNDPYDCKVNFSDCHEQDIFDLTIAYYKKLHPSATEKDCDDFARYATESNPDIFDIQLVRNRESEILIPSLNSNGIVCLSEVNDDILMWSHYADAHKGICLVFSKDIIAKDERFLLRKVKYPEDNSLVPCKSFFEMYMEKRDDIYELLFATKSLHWKYEKEWRILVSAKNIENNTQDENDKRFFVCKDMLTGIIFGWKCSVAFKPVITKLVQNSPIQLFQATRNENSYSIDIERL